MNHSRLTTALAGQLECYRGCCCSPVLRPRRPGVPHVMAVEHHEGRYYGLILLGLFMLKDMGLVSFREL